VRCDGAAVRKLVIMLCSAALAAGAQQAIPGTVSGVSAYDALIEGMACRQQKSGRLDCEFRVGNLMR
jgi:hypothetical protein